MYTKTLMSNLPAVFNGLLRRTDARMIGQRTASRHGRFAWTKMD